MKKETSHSIESELKNKVYFLQKALQECSDIIKTIEKEDTIDKNLLQKIKLEQHQDLSKIRGD